MSEVTRILSAIAQGESHASDELLPLVYQELRRLAAAKLAHEKPGQTLQATALVHEAFLRLVDGDSQHRWDSRAHFFAAAAEAMRRILVDIARRKQTRKHGGGLVRGPEVEELISPTSQLDPLETLAIDESLERLAAVAPRAAELAKLRYFVGCTIAEAAAVLGVAPTTAEADWTYARAWLRREWLRHEKT